MKRGMPKSGIFIDELPQLELGKYYKFNDKWGKVLEEYEKFYLVDFGNYKESVSRIDLALEKAKKKQMSQQEFIEKLLDKGCILDESYKIDAENYVLLMKHDSYKRESGAIKQVGWAKY